MLCFSLVLRLWLSVCVTFRVVLSIVCDCVVSVCHLLWLIISVNLALLLASGITACVVQLNVLLFVCLKFVVKLVAHQLFICPH